MMFRVIRKTGNHYEKQMLYKPGQVFESARELDKIFPGKIERVLPEEVKEKKIVPDVGIPIEQVAPESRTDTDKEIAKAQAPAPVEYKGDSVFKVKRVGEDAFLIQNKSTGASLNVEPIDKTAAESLLGIRIPDDMPVEEQFVTNEGNGDEDDTSGEEDADTEEVAPVAKTVAPKATKKSTRTRRKL